MKCAPQHMHYETVHQINDRSKHVNTSSPVSKWTNEWPDFPSNVPVIYAPRHTDAGPDATHYGPAHHMVWL